MALRIHTTLGKRQYLKQYPERRGKAKESEDYLEYISRADPFALYGGTSSQKLFELVQIGKGFLRRTLSDFVLSVNALTESNNFSSIKVGYTCDDLKLEENNYRYCERKSF